MPKHERNNRGPLAVSLAAAAATLAVGCGSDGAAGSREATKTKASAPRAPDQVLELMVKAAPGSITFDKRRLRAKPGKVAIELTNPTRLGHNVRIATGTKCCFRPGSNDIGGTTTIGTGKTRAVVHLKPGSYVFYCAIGGHWQLGQRGSLVVE